MSYRNDTIDKLNRYFGKQIQKARIDKRYSRREAGKLVGVTYQQFQKYEKGDCRISADRLALIAHAFELPVGYFYPTSLNKF